MESSNLLADLLSTQSPLLPSPLVSRVWLALGWGLVLAAMATRLVGRAGTPRSGWRFWLVPALLLWCLLPGPASPAYWLGLAFRAPGALFALLCAWTTLRHLRPAAVPPPPVDALRCWALAPVLLGWALLLDTFAVWPVSLYAAGFAPLTSGVLALLCMLPWLSRGDAGLSSLLGLALALHVLLRLPTGNVWDALLDPWLWLLLQADWLRQRLRHA
jgi:hypothetical protein